MAKPEALAKVDADLDRGHTHLAAQRLNSLIAADLYDLDLRSRLAAVHRRTGNAAEAGRWGYLTEDVTEAELTAFAKAYYRSASDQLRALALRGEMPRGLGPLAEARLADLTDRAASPAAPPPSPSPLGTKRWSTPVPTAWSAPAPSPRTAPSPALSPASSPTARPPSDPARKPPDPASPAPLSDAVLGSIFLITIAVLTVIGMVTVVRWFL